MSRMVLICFFTAFLCIYAGCDKQSKIGIDERKVELQPQSSKSSFPVFLVGRWKPADSSPYKWGFKFEKDGKVSAMRNFMDMYIETPEGGAYEQAADANVDSACTLGPVEVNFDPDSRILTVKVVTEYFMFHIYDQMIEGNCVDKIFGPVSEDGLTWTAEWQSVSRMLDGLPLDFNNPSINPVVFYKVKDEDKQPSKGD